MDQRTLRLPRSDLATVPDLLQHALANYPSSGAFHYREGGYWRSLSTEAFCEQVRRMAMGLVRLGLQPGDAVGLLAPPSPSWLMADFAILSAGGVSVPLFTNLAPEHFVFEAKNAGMRFLLVVGAEAWATAAQHLHLFERVIVRGVPGAKGRSVLDHHALGEAGDRQTESDPGQYARLRRALAENAPATIIHTSGSTGMPKGVVLSHGNLVSQVRAANAVFPLDAAQDRAYSCLPLAHVFERMVVLHYIAQGVPLYFCDDIKKVGEQLREVRPTCVTMVPRLLEKVHGRIEKQVADSTGLRRRIGRWALDLAGSPSAHHGWSVGVADALVYRKLRAALGGNLRYLVVGGAALSPPLERFLLNVGIPVYTGYGLTEASPVIAVNAPGQTRPGTVGRVFPGVELRLGPQGEILARGPGIMLRYHKDPQATAATIDGDGWLHTGDVGELDGDGYLTITGRIKEMFKTSNGKYVCPVPIEQELATHELVDMAMVIAEGRRFVSALLFLDPEALRRRKAQLGLADLGDDAYLQRPEVAQELERHVASVNAHLNHWEQVRRWRAVTTVPSVEREELTPTMKLRRHIVQARWAELIEGMYLASEEPAAAERSTPTPPLAVKEQP